MRRIVIRIAGCAAMVLAGAALAARAEAQTLDAAARAEVIDSLIMRLDGSYVFPEVAVRMGEDLRGRQARGEYGDAVAPQSFAARVTEDLQAISRDRHLRVRTGMPAVPAAASGRGAAPVTPFGRTERMEGDVAYIEVRTFGIPPAQVRGVVRDGMDAAADARALIIDLRTNGGGSPGLVALISSYLFDDEPVHLNSLYWRPSDTTQDFFTDPEVEGRKFGGAKPVFVLTSGRTFSAAEEFTYNLQTRGRATIVGETTGGGAHPGRVVSLPHGLSVFIPSGRAINPITGTNWEGTGVTPDVAVPAGDALETALRLARAQS
jgi:hypothetical protein